MTTTATADIEIDGGNGFYIISASSYAGEEWMTENIGGAQGLPGDIQAFCDDTRLTQDIADGAAGDGLNVEVNGKVYRVAEAK